MPRRTRAGLIIAGLAALAGGFIWLMAAKSHKGAWLDVAVLNGFTEIIGGTSLSSPVFASVLTRINEERLLAGKSTVGFVQPALVSSLAALDPWQTH